MTGGKPSYFTYILEAPVPGLTAESKPQGGIAFIVVTATKDVVPDKYSVYIADTAGNSKTIMLKVAKKRDTTETAPPPPPSPGDEEVTDDFEATLSPETITQIQCELGMADAERTGKIDDKTREAIKKFENSETGKLSQELVNSSLQLNQCPA